MVKASKINYNNKIDILHVERKFIRSVSKSKLSENKTLAMNQMNYA